jgi:hypothetical protein
MQKMTALSQYLEIDFVIEAQKFCYDVQTLQSDLKPAA